jgi:hypothetical protein
MYVPELQGVIARRLLLNYRVSPEVLERLLPEPFRPKLYRGYGIAGVCLIRFRQLRPRGLPAVCGFSSENAAFRVAVCWRENGRDRDGVFIWKRLTNSRCNAWLGGWLFPTVLRYARFRVSETSSRLTISVSESGDEDLRVVAERVQQWQGNSVFAHLQEAAEFFWQGAMGYSPGLEPGRYEGIELHCPRWEVEPLRLLEARCRFYEAPSRFPAGSIVLDSALLMRAKEHSWQSLPSICCSGRQAAAV